MVRLADRGKIFFSERRMCRTLSGLQAGGEGGRGRWWQKEAGVVEGKRSQGLLRMLPGHTTEIARVFRAPPRHDRRRGSRRPMPSDLRIATSSGPRYTGVCSASNSPLVYLVGHVLAGVEQPARELTLTHRSHSGTRSAALDSRVGMGACAPQAKTKMADCSKEHGETEK